MLTLFFAPGSSSMAPHIALHEIGAEFEAKPVSFARREQKEADYLAINAEGRIPTLLIDGRPMTEVAGILFYLGRRFAEAGLLPDDEVEGVARVISWMSYIAATIHPARGRGADIAGPAFAIAEQRLGGRQWAVGDRMSIADIHLFRLFWRLKRGDEDIAAQFPGLLDHYGRMMERPSVIKTIAIESKLGYELPR